MTDERECNWTEDEFDSYWNTACDHAFEFNDGDPHDNHFKFCPYCGKPLTFDTMEGRNGD